MAFAENTVAEQGKQPYKYNNKELDQMHGLNWYDYSARFYEPSLGRFTTMDPLAEKYYGWSPYAYVMNNPMKYVDIKGDSLTLHGQQDLLNQVSAVHNNSLDGYYTFSVGTGGVTTLVATNKDRTTDPAAFASAEAYFKELNTVVNGTEGMAHIMVVNGSENVMIGSYTNGRIDMGDIQKLPQNGEILTQGSAIIHETVEQYHSRVINPNSTYDEAHEVATQAESRVLGVAMDPNRGSQTMGRAGQPATGFLPVVTQDGRMVQYIYYRYNNVTNVGNLIRK
jgi:RHS repeat-associated protein